jgi:hypothetical protein
MREHAVDYDAVTPVNPQAAAGDTATSRSSDSRHRGSCELL